MEELARTPSKYDASCPHFSVSEIAVKFQQVRESRYRSKRGTTPATSARRDKGPHPSGCCSVWLLAGGRRVSVSQVVASVFLFFSLSAAPPTSPHHYHSPTSPSVYHPTHWFNSSRILNPAWFRPSIPLNPLYFRFSIYLFISVALIPPPPHSKQPLRPPTSRLWPDHKTLRHSTH